jgi:hypothetical protein
MESWLGTGGRFPALSEYDQEMERVVQLEPLLAEINVARRLASDLEGDSAFTRNA